MFENITTQPSKCRTKNRLKMIDDARGNYNPNSQIKFKTIIWKSNLCHYIDAYMLSKGIIAVAGAGMEFYWLFKGEKNIRVVMPTCSLLKYCETDTDKPTLKIVILLILMMIRLLTYLNIKQK